MSPEEQFKHWTTHGDDDFILELLSPLASVVNIKEAIQDERWKKYLMEIFAYVCCNIWFRWYRIKFRQDYTYSDLRFIMEEIRELPTDDEKYGGSRPPITEVPRVHAAKVDATQDP